MIRFNIKSILLFLLLFLPRISSVVFAQDNPFAKSEVSQLIYHERFEEALQILKTQKQSDVVLWQKAYCLLGSEKFDEAHETFSELSASPYRDYGLVLACIGSDNEKDAIKILEKANFPPPLNFKAANSLYTIYKKQDDFEKALSQIDLLRREFPTEFSRRWADVEKLRIEIAKNSKDNRAVKNIFDRIMKNRGDSHALRAAKLAKGKVSSKERLIAMAETFYNKKSWKDALAYYEKSARIEADSKTHFRIARCNDKLGNYTKALGLYRSIRKEKLFNDGWAAYGEVRCLRKLDKHEQALDVLKKSKSSWEKTSAEPYAKWEGYEIGRETNNYSLAGAWASKIADDHPTHDLGDNSFVLAGIFYHLAKKQGSARKYFDKIHTSGYFTNTAFKNVGKYWACRNGGTTNPQSEDELPDFYTYHHKKQITSLSVPNSAGTKPDMSKSYNEIRSLLTKADFTQGKLDKKDSHLQWGKFFAQIGVYRWAEWEYETYFEKNSDIHKSLAGLDLFIELADLEMSNLTYELGVDIVAQYKRKTDYVPKVLSTLEYPVFFVDRLWELGDQYGIDPFFVLSVMRQESRFDVKARSWANARGLMQVIPSTGSTIAKEISSKNFKPELLYDPDISMEFGTHLLAKLIKEMDGPYTALAAYNAGERKVPHWQEIPGTTEDMLLFTELVDYGETRRYIRKVIQNYIRYKLIYDKEL